MDVERCDILENYNVYELYNLLQIEKTRATACILEISEPV